MPNTHKPRSIPDLEEKSFLSLPGAAGEFCGVASAALKHAVPPQALFCTDTQPSLCLLPLCWSMNGLIVCVPSK